MRRGLGLALVISLCFALPGVAARARDARLRQAPLRLRGGQAAAARDRRCRHTVGRKDVAIGIEHVGYTDGDVLNNNRRLRASLRLTAWRLRKQTHGDWSHASMKVYRRRLARKPCEATG